MNPGLVLFSRLKGYESRFSLVCETLNEFILGLVHKYLSRLTDNTNTVNTGTNSSGLL